MNVFGMGPLELFLILALALVVFGPDKLPDLARQVGKAVGEIRRISSEVTGEIHRGLQLDDVGKPPRSVFQPPSVPTPPPDAGASPTAAPFSRSAGDDVRPPY